MHVKTTYSIDAADQPLITADDGSVLIELNDPGQRRALDIFLAPALFGALRSAMDKAEAARSG